MKKILEAWDIKTLQEFINISLHLETNGKTLQDVKDHVKGIKDIFIDKKTLKNKKYSPKKCPSCNTGLLIPTAGNDEGGEGIWACKKCRYSEYDGRTVGEMIKSLRS